MGVSKTARVDGKVAIVVALEQLDFSVLGKLIKKISSQGVDRKASTVVCGCPHGLGPFTPILFSFRGHRESARCSGV